MNRFETILDLDTSNRDYDSESCIMLLWAKDGSGLYVLTAGGCTCCGNMYDDIKASNAVPVTDLLKTAMAMYTATIESDDPDVPALREGLIKAIALTGYALPLPELEG